MEDTIALSWVSGADGSEFPVQNLPMGVFSHAPSGRDPRIGVAIGDVVVDMRRLLEEGLLDGYEHAAVFGESTLNAFMARPRAEWQAVRARLTALLARGGGDDALSNRPDRQTRCLVRRAEVRMHLPARIGDYTDFYSSREHATNVGTMFRGKDNALQPNWLHLPVGYHGRASSVVTSGTQVVRPCGQIQLDKTDPTKGTEHIPCRLFDFELEMGFFVGGPANPMGTPINIADASDRIFGFVLCNDWSARDVQKFEYVPLGPFGAKNFCTQISPWVVMTDALEPFKCATSAGEQTEVVPLEYLRDPSYTSYDVDLTVEITPAAAGATPTVVSRSNYRNQYWTCRQQLTHHAVTGCDMQPGDMLASGTISGTEPGSYGSMLELCWQGTKEVGPLSDGSMRKFLKDGDTVTLRGACRHAAGYTVGFGECAGQLLPAGTPPPPVPPPPMPAVHDVRLLSYWRSSCSWRVRIALAFYHIRYKYVAVNLLEGAQRSVSEMGQVPRLDWKDAAGAEVSLTQSLPIIEMLADLCDGVGKRSLRPVDLTQRARARQIAEIFNAGTQPLQNLSHIKEMQGERPTDVIDGRAIAKAAIVRGCAAAEAILGRRTDGETRYCVGSSLSIADCCLVPQLYNARRFGVDLEAVCPKLLAVESHLLGLPAVKAAHPDACADAVIGAS